MEVRNYEEEEICFWRETFLGSHSCNGEKILHEHFMNLPSETLIKEGLMECYKESAKYALRKINQ